MNVYPLGALELAVKQSTVDSPTDTMLLLIRELRRVESENERLQKLVKERDLLIGRLVVRGSPLFLSSGYVEEIRP
jgi:hypothetical protein